MSYQLSISVVLYNNQQQEVDYLIKCFQSENIGRILFFLIDNSEEICWKGSDSDIVYIHNKKNIGFGRAHNIAFKQIINKSIPYHLVCNPDIYFEKGILSQLLYHLKNDENIGGIAPIILNPDNSYQFQGRNLPTFWAHLKRRFIYPQATFCSSKQFGLKSIDWLTGCFMLLNTESIKYTNGFDSRFFLYMEDVDLSRRIRYKYPLFLDQNSIIYHKKQRGSHASIKLTIFHAISALKYFWKWK